MATERYNAREVEARWQKVWNDKDVFVTHNDDPRDKYYVLEMFPSKTFLRFKVLFFYQLILAPCLYTAIPQLMFW